MAKLVSFIFDQTVCNLLQSASAGEFTLLGLILSQPINLTVVLFLPPSTAKCSCERRCRLNSTETPPIKQVAARRLARVNKTYRHWWHHTSFPQTLCQVRHKALEITELWWLYPRATPPYCSSSIHSAFISACLACDSLFRHLSNAETLAAHPRRRCCWPHPTPRHPHADWLTCRLGNITAHLIPEVTPLRGMYYRYHDFSPFLVGDSQSMSRPQIRCHTQAPHEQTCGRQNDTHTVYGNWRNGINMGQCHCGLRDWKLYVVFIFILFPFYFISFLAACPPIGCRRCLVRIAAAWNNDGMMMTGWRSHHWYFVNIFCSAMFTVSFDKCLERLWHGQNIYFFKNVFKLTVEITDFHLLQVGQESMSFMLETWYCIFNVSLHCCIVFQSHCYIAGLWVFVSVSFCGSFSTRRTI